MNSIKNDGLNEIILSSPSLGRLLISACKKNKAFKFRAKGGSMSPFIRNDDLIIIKPYTSPPKVRDVAAYIFEETEQLFVHRIIKKRNGNYFVFKGDSNQQDDGLVHIDEIHGYVEFVIKKRFQIKYGSILYKMYAFFAERNLTYFGIKYFRLLKNQFRPI